MPGPTPMSPPLDSPATTPTPQQTASFWGDTFGFKTTQITTTPASAAPDPNWEAPAQSRSNWELMAIAGVTITGLWKVMARRAQRVDVKKSPGADGATPTMLGLNPCEVDATVQMWTPQHFTQYTDLLNKLQQVVQKAKAAAKGTPDASSVAVEVFHPALALAGISSMYPLEIGLPRPASIPGVFEATFKLSEFNPLKKASPLTVKGSTRLTDKPMVADYGPGGLVPDPSKSPTQTGP